MSPERTTKRASTGERLAEPFQIGSAVWPGLAKLAEECGELLAVVGKLMAYPDGEHPDGAGKLALRLTMEMGDVKAAIDYVAAHNVDTPRREVDERRDAKFSRFQGWDYGAPRGLCGRVLVGQGTDVLDPTCVLSAGHAGLCKPAEWARTRALR